MNSNSSYGVIIIKKSGCIAALLLLFVAPLYAVTAGNYIVGDTVKRYSSCEFKVIEAWWGDYNSEAKKDVTALVQFNLKNNGNKKIFFPSASEKQFGNPAPNLHKRLMIAVEYDTYLCTPNFNGCSGAGSRREDFYFEQDKPVELTITNCR
jgi:hypothetical protein